MSAWEYELDIFGVMRVDVRVMRLGHGWISAGICRGYM